MFSEGVWERDAVCVRGGGRRGIPGGASRGVFLPDGQACRGHVLLPRARGGLRGEDARGGGGVGEGAAAGVCVTGHRAIAPELFHLRNKSLTIHAAAGAAGVVVG